MWRDPRVCDQAPHTRRHPVTSAPYTVAFPGRATHEWQKEDAVDGTHAEPPRCKFHIPLDISVTATYVIMYLCALSAEFGSEAEAKHRRWSELRIANNCQLLLRQLRRRLATHVLLIYSILQLCLKMPDLVKSPNDCETIQLQVSWMSQLYPACTSAEH